MSTDSDRPIPPSSDITAGRHPWLRWLAVAAFVVGTGLWMDFQSGLSILRGTSLARAVVGVLGLGGLAVAAEFTAEAITERDKTTDPLWRRGIHLSLLLAAGLLWLALVWLWSRAFSAAQ